MREMIDAAVLGAIEALTEFLPVSSTGHLIVAADMLGFDGPPGKVFEVVIQMGAILAVMVVYFQRLWNVALGLRRDPESWKFAAAILLAFLPAAVIGVFLHKYIKGYLFNTTVVAISMIVGGIVILIVERIRPVPKVARIEDFSPALSLKIGFIQCLAMVPGVSRSGGTITAGLFLREFTGGLPWVHLDIAGTARASADDGEIVKGGTGFGVRTLVELARTFEVPRP